MAAVNAVVIASQTHGYAVRTPPLSGRLLNAPFQLRSETRWKR